MSCPETGEKFSNLSKNSKLLIRQSKSGYVYPMSELVSKNIIYCKINTGPQIIKKIREIRGSF